MKKKDYMSRMACPHGIMKGIRNCRKCRYGEDFGDGTGICILNYDEE